MPVLMTFTAQQAARLANISVWKLRYWEQTDVFRPEYLERRARSFSENLHVPGSREPPNPGLTPDAAEAPVA